MVFAGLCPALVQGSGDGKAQRALGMPPSLPAVPWVHFQGTAVPPTPVPRHATAVSPALSSNNRRNLDLRRQARPCRSLGRWGLVLRSLRGL